MVGDRVLLNVGALDRGLGTGGYALVVAIPDRLPEDPPENGHLVKARYTPLQSMVLGADEQDSPDHDSTARRRRPPRYAGRGGGSALGAARRTGRGVRGSARHAGRLRDDGRRGAAAGVLPDCAGTAGRRLARRDRDRRTGVRRRPGGCDGPHRPADGSTRAGGRARRTDAGAGQPRHWHPLGLLRRPVGRSRQRRSAPSAAGLSRRCGSPRPIRDPRHRGISHHSLTAYGRVALQSADVVVPDLDGDFGDLGTRRGRAAARPGTGSSGSASTACTTPCRPRRSSCPRWAGTSTATARTSKPPPRPDGTRPGWWMYHHQDRGPSTPDHPARAAESWGMATNLTIHDMVAPEAAGTARARPAVVPGRSARTWRSPCSA